VSDLSAIFADSGRMEKLLAEWKNPIRPLPKVAESGQIESILAEWNNWIRPAPKIAESVLFMTKLSPKWAYFLTVVLEERVNHDIALSSGKSRGWPEEEARSWYHHFW
jgi:hypothetical protein